MTVQQSVQQLLNEQVERGEQIGVQACAYRGEEVVVDAVAGQMGPEDPRPVQPDSLFLSFSTTKGIAALAVHMLADRGLIDYDAPVAEYWPEFGQHGKDKLTIAQALSHQAGLHRMPREFEPEHITDWDAGIRRMEEGEPAYEPGTATGYHAVTWGWIVGGIVQGASGRSIQEVVREDIAEPLGIADEMFIGIPDGVEDRLTTLKILVAGEGLDLPPDAEMFQAMPRTMWPLFNEMPFRQAVLPSGNGHFTARALAKTYAALANGGEIGGVRLVSPERIPEMQRLITQDVDRVLGMPMRKSAGFFLGGEAEGIHGPMGPRETAFGHPGAGGSIAYADPDMNLAMAVTINKMAAPLPGQGAVLAITDLIREKLGAA